MLKYYANVFCKNTDKNLEINIISHWPQNLCLTYMPWMHRASLSGNSGYLYRDKDGREFYCSECIPPVLYVLS